MEKRHVKSGEDPRAYADVFARLTSGSPPPPPGRLRKVIGELRRRAVVIGQEVREKRIVLAGRVRAKAGAALRRGREETVLLVELVREVRGGLARQIREERSVLAGRAREARVALVRSLEVKRAALVERVREARGALARLIREEKSVLSDRARESRVALVRRVDEKRVALMWRVRESRGALVRYVREEKVIFMRGVGEVTATLVRRLREERMVLARRTREERAALGHALREQRTALAARIHETKAAFAHRLRDWAAARPRWSFEWHRSGPPAPPREPSLFVGLASFAFAIGIAWYTGGPTDEVPERKSIVVAEEAVAEEALPVQASMPSTNQPAVLDVGHVLRTPGVSEATQLAVVDQLTKDPSDVATNALLAGVDAESLYVSMASLRALAGRSCESVAAALANRLDDPMWQRRAWAARVLGSNECVGAGRHLSERLAVEPDARVQAQLKIAINSLKMAINSLKEPGA